MKNKILYIVIVIAILIATFCVIKNRNTLNKTKIVGEEQVKNLLLKKNPENKEYYEYHSLELKTLGENYALLTQSRQGGGLAALIVNLKTGDHNYINGDYGFMVGNMSIIFDWNKIYYYKTDSASANILPNSELENKNETYNSWGDIFVSPKETHTNESMTIDIFDLSTIVGEQDQGNQQYKKLRTETFYFPQ